MDIGSKCKVLAADKGRAIVQKGGKKITVGVRDDIKIKKGDMVIIVLGNIVGKV
ncbi:MAG: hypothetical protein GOV02_02590 [Candidatus Aenigmarchaeota archaeon]|nr:hypothetical protein [Candidatus Aenigmarchaeota archaeon]